MLCQNAGRNFYNGRRHRANTAAGDQDEVRQSQAASMSRANSSGTHVFHLISALPQGSLNGTHLRGSKQYKSMVSLRDFPY